MNFPLYIALGIIVVVALGYLLLYRTEIKYTMQLLKKGITIFPHTLVSIGNTDLSHDEVSEIQAIRRNDNLRVKWRQLILFNIRGGDVFMFLDAYRKAQNNNIEAITPEMLFDIYHAKGDMKGFVDVAAIAQNSNVEYNIHELVSEHFPAGDMRKCVNAMIMSKKSGMQIPQKDLLNYYRIGGDMEKFSYAMVRSKKLNMDLNKEDFIAITLTGGDVQEFVEAVAESMKLSMQVPVKKLLEHNLPGDTMKRIIKMLIKAKEANISVSLDSLIDHARMKGDVEKLVNTLIKSNEMGLNTSFQELERFFLEQGDVDKFFRALRLSKKAKLGISNSKLFEIHNAKVDILKFVQGVSKGAELAVSADDIEMDFIEGRDVLDILATVEYAKNMEVDLDYKLAMTIERNGHDVKNIVNQSLNPRIYKMQPATVVTQDGVELILSASVLAKLRISQFFRGSKEDVLSHRINELLIREVEYFDDHKEVIRNLNVISKRVLKRILGEEEPLDDIYKDKFTLEEELKLSNEKQRRLNESSALEVLDVNIPEVITGRDTLAELQKFRAKSEAQARKYIAETQMIEAEAEIKKSMAKGFSDGSNRNFNEYHKKELLETKPETRHGRHHDDA